MSETRNSNSNSKEAAKEVAVEGEKKDPCCTFFNRHSQRKNQLRKRVTIGPTIKTASTIASTEKDEKEDDNSYDETNVLDILPTKRAKRTPLSDIQTVKIHTHKTHTIKLFFFFSSTDTKNK